MRNDSSSCFKLHKQIFFLSIFKTDINLFISFLTLYKNFSNTTRLPYYNMTFVDI